MLKVPEKSLESVIIGGELTILKGLQKYKDKKLAEIIIWEGSDDLIDFVFEDGSYCTISIETDKILDVIKTLYQSARIWYPNIDLDEFYNIEFSKSWLWTPEKGLEVFK